MLCKELKKVGFLGCALNPCGYKKGGYINGVVMLDIHMLWVFKSKYINVEIIRLLQIYYSGIFSYKNLMLNL